jgi:hypothetical protein
MIGSANRDAANAYTPDELITDLRNGIFSELSAKKSVDAYRRNVQKSLVENLILLLGNSAAPGGGINIGFGGPSVDLKKTDLPSIARGQLSNLRSALLAGATGAVDKLTRYHFQDLAERIRNALEPK